MALRWEPLPPRVRAGARRDGLIAARWGERVTRFARVGGGALRYLRVLDGFDA